MTNSKITSFFNSCFSCFEYTTKKKEEIFVKRQEQ